MDKSINIKQINKNKCWFCNKKIGIFNYECKCNYVFCQKHRLSFDHNCSFDFKKEAQNKIKNENPIIKKLKLEPI